MEVRAGLRVRRVGDRVETARFLADLYGWWQKPWEGHTSHLALHLEQPDVALFTKPPLLRMVAAELPGVGFKKSKAVCQKFRSVTEMVNASKDQWAEIDGIGETLAGRIYDALRR